MTVFFPFHQTRSVLDNTCLSNQAYRVVALIVLTSIISHSVVSDTYMHFYQQQRDRKLKSEFLVLHQYKLDGVPGVAAEIDNK